MKFYIASKLENAETVKKVANVLKAAGHSHTYDWTTHGSVKEITGNKKESIDRLTQVAESERKGVLDADILVVLLPGGRGTHVELGIALGADNRNIIICAETHEFFECDDKTCAFYWNKGIIRIAGTFDIWVAGILKVGFDLDSQAQAG